MRGKIKLRFDFQDRHRQLPGSKLLLATTNLKVNLRSLADDLQRYTGEKGGAKSALRSMAAIGKREFPLTTRCCPRWFAEKAERQLYSDPSFHYKIQIKFYNAMQ
jgi:hypothetical protein